MTEMKFATLPLAAALAVSLSAAASAATIASTDLTGRTVTGSTASNINWQTAGISDPGTIVADFDLFDTPNAQGAFAVDRNLVTEGSWTAEFVVDVLAAAITLDEFSVDALIFNNAGSLQAASRDLDLVLSIVGSGSTLFSQSILNVFPAGGAVSYPATATWDVSSVTLMASGQYTFSIEASSDGTLGNNAGFSSVSLTGTVAAIPVPASLPLLAIGLAGIGGMALRRRGNRG
jgi:hypothetical protein